MPHDAPTTPSAGGRGGGAEPVAPRPGAPADRAASGESRPAPVAVATAPATAGAGHRDWRRLRRILEGPARRFGEIFCAPLSNILLIRSVWFGLPLWFVVVQDLHRAGFALLGIAIGMAARRLLGHSGGAPICARLKANALLIALAGRGWCRRGRIRWGPRSLGGSGRVFPEWGRIAAAATDWGPAPVGAEGWLSAFPRSLGCMARVFCDRRTGG